jgi:hypothetical protein
MLLVNLPCCSKYSANSTEIEALVYTFTEIEPCAFVVVQTEGVLQTQ